MNVSKADIEKVIRESMGNPDSGPIHDYAGSMAQAVADLLQPESKKENRIIKAREIPAAEERID